MDIIPRKAWGAHAPRKASDVQTVTWSRRTEFFVHHTAGAKTQTVKAIQEFHQNGNGWNDVGYNFLVREDGTIYEGRGWLVVGAHCPDHNTSGVSAAFIGNNNPTPAAQAAIRWLYSEACRRAGKALTMLGHGDRYATSCPGSKLQDWVDNGMPPAAQTPKPTDPTETLVKKLPTLGAGDTGWDVKTVHHLLLARDAKGLATADPTVFTPAHTAAVVAIQRAAGLKADGIVGAQTWPVLLRVA